MQWQKPRMSRPRKSRARMVPLPTTSFIDAAWIHTDGSLGAMGTGPNKKFHSAVDGGLTPYMNAGNIRVWFSEFGNGNIEMNVTPTREQIDTIKAWWTGVKVEQGGLYIDAWGKVRQNLAFPPWTKWPKIKAALENIE